MDASQSRIHVRRIGNVTELLEYFKLRHDVYSIMGYLTPEIELCRSGMEINWNDRNAMHWGAFLEQPSGREVLVGTARLALTQLTPANSYWDTLRTFERWTEQLAVRDPVTRSALDQPLLLELPILHSVRDLVSPELIKGGACGELSRVIVAPECRGAGISSRLVRHAVSEAGKIGVGRLFLECLPIHVPLYERSGFEVLPKPAVRVISVKRTMVPMELARRDARSAANPPARCAIPPTPG